MPRHSHEQNLDPAADRAREEEERQQARDDARADAVKTGRIRIKPADLAWAFEGHEDERQAIHRLATATVKRLADRAEQQQQHEALGEMTRRVIKEWDEQRREQARGEARRRLGMEQP